MESPEVEKVPSDYKSLNGTGWAPRMRQFSADFPHVRELPDFQRRRGAESPSARECCSIEETTMWSQCSYNGVMTTAITVRNVPEDASEMNLQPGPRAPGGPSRSSS